MIFFKNRVYIREKSWYNLYGNQEEIAVTADAFVIDCAG